MTVQDIAATVDFYTRVMGMREETFGAGRKALRFGNQKINLHEKGREHDPHAMSPTPGSADLCFVTEQPLAKFMARLNAMHVLILAGPVDRTGAVGPISSVYFRDPDANLIEVSNYTSQSLDSA